MMINGIVEKERPCWYELSWRQKTPAIILKIHKDFVANPPFIAKEESPMVKSLKKVFGFSIFFGDFDKDFGFEGVFKYKGARDDFIEFLVEIPIIRQKTESPCPDCEGSGKDSFSTSYEGGIGRDCFFCGGSGKEHTIDFHLAYAVSASFTVLTRLLDLYEKDTSAALFQLIAVDTITQNGACPLWFAGRRVQRFPVWVVGYYWEGYSRNDSSNENRLQTNVRS